MTSVGEGSLEKEASPSECGMDSPSFRVERMSILYFMYYRPQKDDAEES